LDKIGNSPYLASLAQGFIAGWLLAFVKQFERLAVGLYKSS
jgi:hypothetical protein